MTLNLRLIFFDFAVWFRYAGWVRGFFFLMSTILRQSFDNPSTPVRQSFDSRSTIVRQSFDNPSAILRQSFDNRSTILRSEGEHNIFIPLFNLPVPCIYLPLPFYTQLLKSPHTCLLLTTEHSKNKQTHLS